VNLVFNSVITSCPRGELASFLRGNKENLPLRNDELNEVKESLFNFVLLEGTSNSFLIFKVKAI